MSVVHLLRGYNKASDRVAMQYEVPGDLLNEVVRHVTLETSDRDIFGVYPLDDISALAIARIIGCEMQVNKDLLGHDFFLESEADIDTVNHQIAELSAP